MVYIMPQHSETETIMTKDWYKEVPYKGIIY